MDNGQFTEQTLSVTKFGEISPFWQKLKCLGQFYEGLFRIWQKLLSTLANFIYNWAIFHGIKWKNNENYKSHLVTLIPLIVKWKVAQWIVSNRCIVIPPT